VKYIPSEEFLKECGFEKTKDIWSYQMNDKLEVVYLGDGNPWSYQMNDKLEVVYLGDGNPFRLWEQEDYAHCIAIDNYLNIQSDSDLTTFLKIINQNKV